MPHPLSAHARAAHAFGLHSPFPARSQARGWPQAPAGWRPRPSTVRRGGGLGCQTRRSRRCARGIPPGDDTCQWPSHKDDSARYGSHWFYGHGAAGNPRVSELYGLCKSGFRDCVEPKPLNRSAGQCAATPVIGMNDMRNSGALRALGCNALRSYSLWSRQHRMLTSLCGPGVIRHSWLRSHQLGFRAFLGSRNMQPTLVACSLDA